jgi:hypothetical protein
MIRMNKYGAVNGIIFSKEIVILAQCHVVHLKSLMT